MKKILSILSIMLCMITITACNSDDPETESKPVEVEVGPYLVNLPQGFINIPCMEVIFIESKELKYMTQFDILGFNYEEGYTYRLMIKEMRNSNSSEVYYILDRVISKTKFDVPQTPIKPIE